MKAKYIKTCLFAIRSHIRMIRNTFAFVILIACTCLPHFQCDVIFDHAPAPPARPLRCTEHNNDKKRVQMETQERKGIPTKTVSRARYNRRSRLKAMKLVRFSLSYGACCLEESSAPAGLSGGRLFFVAALLYSSGVRVQCMYRLYVHTYVCLTRASHMKSSWLLLSPPPLPLRRLRPGPLPLGLLPLGLLPLGLLPLGLLPLGLSPPGLLPPSGRRYPGHGRWVAGLWVVGLRSWVAGS